MARAATHVWWYGGGGKVTHLWINDPQKKISVNITSKNKRCGELEQILRPTSQFRAYRFPGTDGASEHDFRL
jgi:hypothetical protein